MSTIPPFNVDYSDPFIASVPTAPAVKKLAQDALDLLISTMYPNIQNENEGTPTVQISSVKFEVKFNKTDFEDESDAVKQKFLQEFVVEIARQAKVMEDSIELQSSSYFPFQVKAKAFYMAGALDAQKNAMALTEKLQQSTSSIFSESFSLDFGYASLVDISTETLTPATHNDKSCMPFSDIQVVNVDLHHVNNYPIGCAVGNCSFTFDSGDTNAIEVELPAFDEDCDELEIIISQVPSYGTIHSKNDTDWKNMVHKNDDLI